MAEEPITLPCDKSIEYHIVTLFEKLEALRSETETLRVPKLPLKAEIRTLEFWRSVISECLASFVYVFVVCGAAAGAGLGASISSVLLPTALAAGLAMTSLTQCFGHISGAHINPAVTIAMGITKNITLLRTFMFVVAQCGGAIAGAAFLYGVTVPGYQGNLAVTFTHSVTEAPWEKFGIEFILTFVVVFSYFVSMDSHRKWMGTSALTIGATYSACSFVSMPYLNPARSLGPSFVLNRWECHWVYWIGPMGGGITAGVIYKYIFNANQSKARKDSTDGESSSMHSDEDTYDDLDKPAVPKFHGSTYNTYRAASTSGPAGYCPSLTTASLYSAPAAKLERVESLYGGTKSLYCKSPPLTRANLNRSQSVYTKSNSGVNRDILPKPGPLVPAQSLYPMRLNQQQTHLQNQNLQNQLQQRSESVYGVGVRGVTPGTSARTETYNNTIERNVYGGTTPRTNSQNPSKSEENTKGNRGNRPESMYGILGSQQRRGPSSQSDDSSYISYQSPQMRSNPGNTIPTYHKNSNSSTYGSRTTGGPEGRPSPATTASTSSSYPHSLPQQHSPNSQY